MAVFYEGNDVMKTFNNIFELSVKITLLRGLWYLSRSWLAKFLQIYSFAMTTWEASCFATVFALFKCIWNEYLDLSHMLDLSNAKLLTIILEIAVGALTKPNINTLEEFISYTNIFKNNAQYLIFLFGNFLFGLYL